VAQVPTIGDNCAVLALQLNTDMAAAALFRDDPWAIIERRPVADVPGVAALKIGNPVA